MLLKYSFNLSDEDFRLFSDGLPNGWKSLIANERFKLDIYIYIIIIYIYIYILYMCIAFQRFTNNGINWP